MLTIGITGGIGSGKSYVCDVFKKLNIPVYNADEKARNISNTSDIVKSKIVEIFGEKAYKQGMLDRKLLASIVFNQRAMLEKLNMIIHPAVESDFIDWCRKNNAYPYIIKEAAILFETGIYKKLDKTIAIIAPESIRLQRVIKRDNTNALEIQNRMKNQWSAEKIAALADFIIENDNKKLILPQIINIDKKLRN